MSAIKMLVTAVWRRRWRASLFLAVVAGLVAGVVGASFQAAARADTSLGRFTQRSRIYDYVVQGCPPEVNPSDIEQGKVDFGAVCTDPATSERFRLVMDRVGDVEQTAVFSTFVVLLLDPSVSNHWGRVTLLAGMRTPDSPSPPAHPIILAGRLYDPTAADEIVVSESAAKAAGLHVGDVVRMAGWRQDSLDAGIDGTVAPQTPVLSSKVVGVVRYLDDVQASGTGSLSDSSIPGNVNVYAGPGWTRAHGADLSGYGSGVLVRVREGASSIEGFLAELNKAPEGWFNNAYPVSEVDSASVRRVIDLERRALLVVAFIAIVAGVVFVGLTGVSQLRRDSADSPRLLSLGMTRRELRVRNVLRALSIAVPASVVAAVTIVALSPLGPLGLARQLEFDLSLRFDAVVLTSAVAAVVIVFAFAGLATPVEAGTAQHSARRARASRLGPVSGRIGPVAVVGATMARGRSSRIAIAVTALALAAGVAAGGVVASYDRLVAAPARYGAAWDLVVGQYSQQAPLDAGIAKLRANPAVVTAAGYFEDANIAAVDGKAARFLAWIDYVGHSAPVMASGRAPAGDDETAIGRDTSRQIHKGIGDAVEVVSNNGQTIRLHVVGIVVVNDPIVSQAKAGDGVFVRPDVYARIAGGGHVAQSIVIRLAPHVDRAAAIESVRRDFSGSIREAIPQVEVRNLGRLRSVPWLIAGLIGFLALAALIHAVVTMLSRHRTNLAVLSALGFTRHQRRAVGVLASVALVLIGVAIGVPAGLIGGARLWNAVSGGTGVPSDPALAWLTVVIGSVGALGVTAAMAVATSQGSVRMAPSEQLHAYRE